MKSPKTARKPGRSAERRRGPSSGAAARCEYCGERLAPGRVSVYRRRGRRHVLFQNVPALLCRSCGHREFEAAAVEDMEHRLNQAAPRGRKAELLVVPA